MVCEIQGWGWKTYVGTCLLCIDALFGIAFGPSYALAALITVVGLVLIVYEPFWGILAIGFFSMLGGLQQFGEGLSITKLLLLVTLGVALGKLTIGSVKVSYSRVAFPMVLFITAYATGCAISVQGPTNPLEGWMFVGYGLVFLTVPSLIRTRQQLLCFLGVSATGAVIAAAAGILEQTTGIGLLTIVRGVQQISASNAAVGMHRSDALMFDPNAAAYPQLIAIPLLLGFTLLAKTWIRRGILLAAVVVCAIGLAVTFSRSAFIGTAVSGFVFVSALRPRQAIKCALFVCVISVGVLTIIPGSEITTRFDDIAAERGGASDRLINYSLGRDLLLQHPLIPAGEALFQEQMAGEVGVPLGTHSNILSVAMNGGLIAIAMLMMVLIQYSIATTKALNRVNPPDKVILVAILAAIAGYLTQGLFIANIAWIFLWILAAAPLAPPLRSRDNLSGSQQYQRLILHHLEPRRS